MVLTAREVALIKLSDDTITALVKVMPQTNPIVYAAITASILATYKGTQSAIINKPHHNDA